MLAVTGDKSRNNSENYFTARPKIYHTAMPNNQKGIEVFDNTVCAELKKAIENNINEEIEVYRKMKLLDDDEEEYSIEELDELIKEYEKMLPKLPEAFERYSAEQRIEEFKKSKNEKIQFNKHLDELRKKLEYKFTYPLESMVKRITEEINECHQELINSIFEEFVEKIKKMCPEDRNYEGTIKAVYVDKQSKKVMEIFLELSMKLIEGFTRIITNLGNNEMYSSDIKSYKKLAELEDYINFGLLPDIYWDTILSTIKEKINEFPNNRMNDSKLVKTYSQILLKNLNNSILQIIPKLIEDKLKEHFTEIYNLSVMKNVRIKENNPVIEEPSDESITSNNENIIIVQSLGNEPDKTIDSFINTLSTEKQGINTLVELHTRYFENESNPITPRGLGMILSKTNRFRKSFAFVNGKKITLYKRQIEDLPHSEANKL